MTTLLLAASLFAGQSDPPGVTRTLLKTTPTLEAARVSYAPGAADAAGNHGYDVVLVPLSDGMTAEVDGVPTQWARGVPILISRGAPHAVENTSKHPVSFVEVRTIGDSLGSGNDATDVTGASIVRSTYSKYVRATVWRVGGRGSVEWPGDTDQVLIVNRNPAVPPSTGPLDEDVVSVLSGRVVRNAGYDEEIIVRISRMAPAGPPG